MKNKLWISILALFTVLCMLPAATGRAENSGTTDFNLNWVLDDAGTLTISGSGPMDDFLVPISVPWFGEEIKKVVIEDGITSIGTNAFNAMGDVLTEVVIPDSVVSIGNSAFRYCAALEKINIPNSVVEIGANAFDSCSGLKTLVIPDSVERIGEYAFHNCSSLVSAIISNNLEDIPNSMFSSCVNLRVVRLGNKTETIGNNAFHGCTSLINMEFPDELYRVGDYAFYGCTSLSTITLGKNTGSFGLDAFVECKALYKVINNSGMTLELGEQYQDTERGGLLYYAFVLVDAEGNMTFPADGWQGNWVKTNDDFLFQVLGDYAFLKGYVGEKDTVTLPESYEGNAYYIQGLRGVKNLIIPDTFTAIDDEAFANAVELVSVTIPGSVKSIGWRAFYNCGSLTDVNLANGLESIQAQAFFDCPYLTKIWLPSTVTSIGDMAFIGEHWTHVLYEGTEQQWDFVSRWNSEAAQPFYDTLRHYECAGSEVSVNVISRPNCVAQGVAEHACSVCQTTVQVLIPQTEHTWQAATCTNPQTCTSCLATLGDPKDPGRQHSWGDGTITKEATCGESGDMTCICTKCSDVKIESIPATGDHSYDGSSDMTCNACGHNRQGSGNGNDNDNGNGNGNGSGNQSGNPSGGAEGDDTKSPGSTIWIILIVLIVLAAAGVVVVMFLKKKKVQAS